MTAKFLYLVPRGDSQIGVQFTLVHGKGTRVEVVAVPIDLILRVADAYRGCLSNPHHLHPGESPHKAGHATWHADNPDSPIPCTEHAAHSPPAELAQHVRNYLGSLERLADYAARAASGKPYIGHADDVRITERQRDAALEAMRKAAV